MIENDQCIWRATVQLLHGKHQDQYVHTNCHKTQWNPETKQQIQNHEFLFWARLNAFWNVLSASDVLLNSGDSTFQAWNIDTIWAKNDSHYQGPRRKENTWEYNNKLNLEQYHFWSQWGKKKKRGCLHHKNSVAQERKSNTKFTLSPKWICFSCSIQQFSL